MPDKNDIITAFTEMAPKYEMTVDSELKRFWGWSYDGFIENLIQLTPCKSEDVVLDVATGTGVIPLKLIQRGKRAGKIHGLDITLAMLQRARRKTRDAPANGLVALTCASAMAMPYRDGFFDVIVCGLATHHLDVPLILSEMQRVLKNGGHLTIADVAGSQSWRGPVLGALIKTATFLYFLPREGIARARSEAGALANVYTADEWRDNLAQAGFSSIDVVRLTTEHAWSPAPLVMRATKDSKEG
jgi:ubiquinone/menaquinone biosynthesis C-methylase UbiE